MSISKLQQDEIQKKIWDEEKVRAQILGLCTGGCNWLVMETQTGRQLCSCNAGCLYIDKGGKL